MIEYTSGDILRDESEALVNTVNCVGVMGRGIALQFRNVWPANFKAYAVACDRNEVQPGRMFVFDTGRVTHPRYIINFPTKRHWRGKSRIEDIEAGLKDLIEVIRVRGIRSVALPPLGSGLGGLEWTEVRAKIDEALGTLPDVRVRVYEPSSAPERMAHAREVPKMTPGRAALVGLINRYLSGLLDPLISLLEVHKLMYFMQESGQPLQLHYRKGPYGPYAENLRHVLRAIEGHMVAGYSDGGDAPDKLLRLVPGAQEEAQAFLQEEFDTLARFDRVSALVEGFESSYGLELLATVHWVATQEEQPADVDTIMQRVYGWSARKQQFTPRQIELAAGVLASQGWINTPERYPSP